VQRRRVLYDESGEARGRRAIPKRPAGSKVGSDAIVIDRRDVALGNCGQADGGRRAKALVSEPVAVIGAADAKAFVNRRFEGECARREKEAQICLSSSRGG
jgi:hypothetical protein